MVSSCDFSTPKKVEENKWPILEVKENTIEEAASVIPMPLYLIFWKLF